LENEQKAQILIQEHQKKLEEEKKEQERRIHEESLKQKELEVTVKLQQLE
jgi:hypothetical protein